jgi:hypothetical protein
VKLGGQEAAIALAGNDAISVTAPDHAPGVVDVQVTTAGGVSGVGDATRFTYPEPAGPPVDATPVPMVLGSLAIAPSSFRTANLGGPIAAARIAAAPVAAKVSYAVSKPAIVTFTIQRLRSGRRVGKSCVAPTPKRRHAKKCTRTTTLKTTFPHGAQSGDNAFTFTGRLDGKALPVGTYRLSAIAKDTVGTTSGPALIGFHIVR